MPYDYEGLREKLEQLERHRKDAGTLGRPDYEIVHTPESLPDADGLRRIRDLGVTTIFLAPWSPDVGQQAPSTQLLRRRIEEYGMICAALKD